MGNTHSTFKLTLKGKTVRLTSRDLNLDKLGQIRSNWVKLGRTGSWENWENQVSKDYPRDMLKIGDIGIDHCLVSII